MSEGFKSSPEDLRTHSATVIRVGEDLSAAGDKGASVDLGIETYGIIGQAFSGNAKEQITQTANAIKDMGSGLTTFGEGVQAAGDAYQQADDDISEFVKTFGEK